jgi:diacylglycerol kinase (ATP)
LINHLPDGVPLSVLPLGTENLLSKYLGQNAEPAALAARLAAGGVARLDAGCANGKLFALVAGCGFDADVVQRLHEGRRGHIRHWTYAKPILAAIRSYQYPPLRIYCDATAEIRPDADQQSDLAASDSWMTSAWSCRWVFIVNLPRYAGGLNFIPHASGTDGLLDICTFRGGRFWNGIRYVYGVMAGRHLNWTEVRCVKARRIRVECDVPAGYQLDGDPGGPLPLDIQVIPERLAIVVDGRWGAEHGFVDATRSPAVIESQRD